MFDPSKPPQTLPELAHRAFKHTERPFLGVRQAATKAYKYFTYGEIALRVRHLAGGLLEWKINRGDRAVILAENRPEWAIADLACQMLGVISVPVFSTLPAVQIEGILRDCGARLIFVSSAAQREKITAIAARLPDLQFVVTMDEMVDSASEEASWRQMNFGDLEKSGAKYLQQNPGEYEATWPAAAPDDVATIIYTSGTTGEPKGVMLTQRNFLTNIEDLLRILSTSLPVDANDVFLSFLPLAHIYERTAGYYLPIRVGASIAYCESLRTVDRNLQEARPTMMFCVPRLYEAFQEKLLAYAESLPADKAGKYQDALQLAKKAGAARGGLPNAPALSLMEKLKYKLYDAAVYSKIRDKFGGRLRAFVSGGAPMSRDIGALFLGMNINICEGYGLTETSPVIAVNRPGRIRLGTVGEVMPSVELKIAPDGEILVRGNSIMKGYWEKPAATAEALDEDGWFHTGDIGVLENNYLKITDRKKDLLVLANGKKVAPAPIETLLTQSRYIEQVVLLGDKQKAVSALIVPQLEAVREYAAKQNLEYASDDELLKSQPIHQLMRREIDALTGDLADFERVRKFNLLPNAFSVETGEMTPTLKIKRRVVAEKYADLVGSKSDD